MTLVHVVLINLFISYLPFTENQDPMVNVMGAAYASVNSSDRPLLKAHADLSKAREDSSENVDEQEARFTLSLLISEMDKQLLMTSHNTIAK